MRVNGKIYRVKSTIKESRSAKKAGEINNLYTYEVIEIEVLEEKSNTSLGSAQPHLKDEPDVEATKLGNNSDISKISGRELLKNAIKSGYAETENPPMLLDESAKASAENHNLRDGRGPVSDAELQLANDPLQRLAGPAVRTPRQRRELAEDVRREMRSTAEALADEFGLDVTILDDNSGLSGRKARAKGFADTKTGRMAVIISNHHSVEDVAKTMIHDGIAHIGLREMVGRERFDNFLDDVYDMTEPEIKERIHKIKEKERRYRPGASEEELNRIATEEFIAEVSENGLLSE